MNNILLAPTTFAEYSKDPLEVININNYKYIVNPKGRKLENFAIVSPKVQFQEEYMDRPY